MGATKKRIDIQLMRGVAVLAVIVFHAFRDILPKGFLGVDIFFVISGFLITGHILQRLEDHTFTFKGFYIRRARRLLPASFATLTVTSLLAMVILVPSDFKDYAWQLIGAVTFTANFALMFQTGYFAGAAETKPLLHIWSLSLEEQFYFVAPVVLWLTPLRRRPLLLALGMVVSLTLCILLVMSPDMLGLSGRRGSNLAFFMLPSRAWELLIGGVAAWCMLKKPFLTIPKSVKYLNLAIMIGLLVVGLSPVHPGPDAIIITVATSIILLGHDNWLSDNFVTRTFVKVGDWSYSLYLVHWPLFAFASIIYLGDVPQFVSIALGMCTFLLGWAQYRFVEIPFLDRTAVPRQILRTLSIPAAGLVGILAVMATTSQAAPGFEQIEGLDESCNRSGVLYENLPTCRTVREPTTILWGDSYAAQLVPGMRGIGFEQVTKLSCAPIPELGYSNSNNTVIWARECGEFNRNVMLEIANRPEIQSVIIASSWMQVMGEADQKLVIAGIEQEWSPIAKTYLERAVRDLQALGKNVILIGPTATAKHDVGACNLRNLSGRLTLRTGGCGATPEELESLIGSSVRDLREVAKSTGAKLLLPSETLCPQGQCEVIHDGKSIYRDAGHLTPSGSAYVIDKIKLRAWINQPADN